MDHQRRGCSPGSPRPITGRPIKKADVHPSKGMLPLIEFEPNSMLKVPETAVEKPRFPVIDIHTHLTFSPNYSDPAPDGGSSHVLAPLAEVLPVHGPERPSNPREPHRRLWQGAGSIQLRLSRSPIRTGS